MNNKYKEVLGKIVSIPLVIDDHPNSYHADLMQKMAKDVLENIVENPVRVEIDTSQTPVLWCGVDPDGNAKPIQVDKDGYVILKKENS